MRPTWKGSISFGLVYIPIAVYPATREEKISFRQLRKTDLSPIRYKKVADADQKEVPADQIVKGFEYERGRYIVLSDEDFEKVRIESTHSIDITDFVDLDQVDPKFFYKPYFLESQKGGEKAYALLFEALRKSGFVGIAKVAMHNREHIVILRPGKQGLVLHTMYYADEVRAVEEFRSNSDLVQQKELELAQMFVQSLAGEFEPEKYHDQYRLNLQEMIAAKVEGKAIVEPEPARPLAPVVDIMEALKASMAKLGERKLGEKKLGEPKPAEGKPGPRKAAGKKPVQSTLEIAASVDESVEEAAAKPKRARKIASGK